MNEGPKPALQVQQPSATDYLLTQGGLVPFKPSGESGRPPGVKVTRFGDVPIEDCAELARAMDAQLRLPNATYEVRPGSQQGQSEAYVHAAHMGPVLVGDMVGGSIHTQINYFGL
jgi:hypothetical protein